MNTILSLCLPVIGLVLIGYGAGRFGAIARDGLAGLNFFVFYFAVPALFFRGLAESTTGLFDLTFVLTTTFSTYCAFAIAFSVGAMMNRGNIAVATICGMAGSNGNIGYLAPALTLMALGPAAAAPTGLIFLFDTAMLYLLAPLMMILGGAERSGLPGVGRMLLRRVVLHPFLIATFAGLVYGATGMPVPEPLDGILDLLADAAAPAALITVGAALALAAPGRRSPELGLVLAVKLVAHPLIVYLLLSWVADFDPVWVKTAVILAALPPAANIAVLARHYRVHAAEAGALVFWGSAAALISLTVVLALVMGEVLPADLFR